jgi:DNA-binding NarL/FixJ family response regulator
MTISVFIVDDHAMVRAGVRSQLASSSALSVVGDAADVASAVAAVSELQPDVVLLDVHLPDGTGDVVIEATRAASPDTRFLALSVSDAAEDVIRVIRAGARGYVTKNIGAEDLVDAVVRVAEGDAVFSPRLAGFVLDAFATAPAAAAASSSSELDSLTGRERDVLRLIARGYTYKEAAKELFLSVKTIETHVSSVLRKLQLSNRHELTRWATTQRLV